ncbi:hypothetical protein BX616_004966 [Lobosporangium transversale]|uniref:Cation-transporting ATPase n=1 Tax=Lobosporangium transversale TaxID=64571 RepID=A0A1Y2GGK4_9FUNG|nr:P-type ATPase-like protein [Lobosporangium transversale]KAF9915959.1 hypothetical protein BX616_004966 [Lobosporangium transversale]ORZ10283.1 P-type ATPase-like protein [Lobosporangium transversale]|eukprot:XP_021879190.1 P-type ATPase-like protein [Lobosporangium transversale]
MVSSLSHDPLSNRLLYSNAESISQVEGTQGALSSVPRTNQGNHQSRQLRQLNSHDGSLHNSSNTLTNSRHSCGNASPLALEVHEIDEDEYDDDDDDDDENEASETQPVLIKSSRSKVGNRKPVLEDSVYDRCVQCLHLEEEDVELMFTGYRFLQVRIYLYYIICVLSGGVIFLLGRWMPQYYISFVTEKCAMSLAEIVVIENEWGQMVIERVYTKYYGGLMSSVFSPEQMEKPFDNEELNNDTESSAVLHDMRYFDYQYIRFIYNPQAHVFMQNSHWKDSEWKSIARCGRGLEREIHQDRLLVFGPNLIDVQEKTVGQLLVQEVLHPFYIFQVFSMILWFIDDYIYYAGCILVISTVSVVTELIETKKTMRRMRNMSKFTCNVKVFRTGIWRYIGSDELVPGDVFETTDSDLTVFPCDAVLLTGDCIVNESMLTGESVPVSKIPITEQALQLLDLSMANIPSDLARYFLFSGTKIVRARPGTVAPAKVLRPEDAEHGMSQPARGLAMVVRTGFNTTKGTLIRSMLFPKPNDFQFYRDSFRFIGILACIAVCGFMVSTVNFIRMGVPIKLMIIKALDLITIVVPPALPATMSIGTSFAIARLRKSNIFCISPTRVNIGGKINCMCFDKTGTLTEDGLDVLGVQCVDIETNMFGAMFVQVEELRSASDSMQDWPTSFLHAMATCHSVKSVGGELIGDPLDLKMFDFTRWVLEEGGLGTRTSSVSETGQRPGKSSSGIVSTVVRPPGAKQFDLNEVLSHRPTEMNETETFLELGIIRCFEFVSSLRRMSVIVKKLHSPGMDIYVKGAPEAMIDICLKDTLPFDYAERLSYYTHHGYRVIACATKSMPTLNFIRAQRVKREQMESELTFLGFIVFENKLKPTTASVITTLTNACIRQVMCTGDNVLTAISVSRECGLISRTKQVYAPRFMSGEPTAENPKVIWENIDDSRKTLDSLTLKPAFSNVDEAVVGYEYPVYPEMMDDYVLAVTGECFRWMVDYASTMTLNRMLVKGQIFARMSPDEKHELVECLQAIGYCVGFCGDGANDCGALKAADVGISLSEAEASVAAPFTSRSNDIECVVKVIQEGRAALVTSFSCFKFMALYSIIQFTTVSFLYAFASNLGDFQFLYIDLALILPVAVFMGRTEAFPMLSPKRPTANLVSKKVLTSLIGQILIQGLFQTMLFCIVRQQPWYKPPKYERGAKNIEGFENTSLFFLSIFQYLLIAVVFSVGPPYRKPMNSNRPFLVILVGLTVLSQMIVLLPPQWLSSILQLVDIPLSFRYFIVFMAAVNLGIAMVCERTFFPLIASAIGSLLARRNSNAKQQQPPYQPHRQIEIEPAYSSLNTPPLSSCSISGFAEPETAVGRASGGAKSKPVKTSEQTTKIYKQVEREMNQI